MASIQQLQGVFVDSLGIPPDTDFGELTYRSVPQWDSVAHMRLVADLEAAFDVMLDTDDVVDMSGFAVCRTILGKHGVKFDD